MKIRKAQHAVIQPRSIEKSTKAKGGKTKKRSENTIARSEPSTTSRPQRTVGEVRKERAETFAKTGQRPSWVRSPAQDMLASRLHNQVRQSPTAVDSQQAASPVQQGETAQVRSLVLPGTGASNSSLPAGAVSRVDPGTPHPTGGGHNPLASPATEQASQVGASVLNPEGSVDVTHHQNGSTSVSFGVESSFLESHEAPIRGGFTGTVSGGAFAESQATITTSPLQDNGNRQVQVRLQSETGFQIKGGASRPAGGGVTQAGLDGSAQVGNRESINYDLNIPDSQWEAIRNGQEPLPTPADPSSIPVGSSIVAREESFEGTSLNGTYQGIRAESSLEETQGASFGVERIDNDTVRITTGPYENVSSSVALGPSIEIGGHEFSAQIKASHSVGHSSTQSVDIDISTPAGREAYQSFLDTGRLPSTRHEPVSNRQSVETVTYNHALEAGIQLGPLGLAAELGTTNGTLTISTNNGAQTYRYEGSSASGNSVDLNWTADNNGVRYDNVSLTLGDDAAIANGLGDIARQQGIDPESVQSLTLEFDQQGLQELQNAAVEHARDLYVTNGHIVPQDSPLRDPSLSLEEFRELAANDLLNDGARDLPPTIPQLTQNLILAETPGEIARSLGRTPVLGDAPNEIATELSSYLFNTPDLFQSPHIQIQFNT